MVSKNTITEISTELGIQFANEMFAKKCAELDETILLANLMFDQRCEELDAHLEDSFLAAFEGERISTERIKRIAGKFMDSLISEKVAIDATL